MNVAQSQVIRVARLLTKHEDSCSSDPDCNTQSYAPDACKNVCVRALDPNSCTEEGLHRWDITWTPRKIATPSQSVLCILSPLAPFCTQRGDPTCSRRAEHCTALQSLPARLFHPQWQGPSLPPLPCSDRQRQPPLHTLHSPKISARKAI